MVERHELLGAIDKLELFHVNGEEYGRRRIYRITSLDVWRGLMVKAKEGIFVFQEMVYIGLAHRGDFPRYQRSYDVLKCRESFVLT